MSVFYEENLANYFGLQRRSGLHSETVLIVRAKGNAGQPLSSRPKRLNRAPLSCADPVLNANRNSDRCSSAALAVGVDGGVLCRAG